MRLSKIYSNFEDKFEPIVFKKGLNVIYAETRLPENLNKDLHNLGKSVLANLIDFMFLKKKTPGFFLFKHQEIFQDFIFFLEVHLNSGDYVTIKRSVKDDTLISIKKHTTKDEDFLDLEKEEWDHYDVTIKKAKTILDSYFNLTRIKPWNYRQGISYFLRSQEDFLDEFQLSKFQGGHIDWKPYVTHILGFNGENVEAKYKLENEITTLAEKLNKEKLKLYMANSLDELKGMLLIGQNEVDEAANKLDQFDFSLTEEKINEELINDIEKKISLINRDKYIVEHNIDKIKSSIGTKFKFDIRNIERIFIDTEIYFQEQLKKDYQALVKFNQRITKDREQYLKDQLEELEEDLSRIIEEKSSLNLKRQEALESLQCEDTFDKFKKLQKKINKDNLHIEEIKRQIELMLLIEKMQKDIDDLTSKKKKITEEIKQQIDRGSEHYKTIRLSFNEICKKVFNTQAVIHIEINNNDNLDFKIDTKNSIGNDTSGSKGYSYKKMLCAALDLSVLRAYYNENFYHFAYHDGIFESLDPRKRKMLLEVIEQYCDQYEIQHIITVLDSYWPLDKGNKYLFYEENIVKILHDNGDDGRLFKIPEW